MPAYPLTVKRYEQYQYDEDLEEETGNLTGYSVFSIIQVGPYTRVRACVDNPEGKPAPAKSRVWFVEYHVETSKRSSTIRLTTMGRETNRAEALRIAERAAALLPATGLPTDMDELFALFSTLASEVRT